jgi:hypothetical protein
MKQTKQEEETIGVEDITDDNNNDENNTIKGGSRTPLTFDDIGIGKFIKLSIGNTVELVVSRIEKVQDEKYCLTNSKDTEGKTYKIEVIDIDNQILSITSWSLWNRVSFAIKDAGIIENLQLKISHPKHGEYEVYYMKDGEYKKVTIEK